MDDELLDFLLANLGKPRPCAICGVLTDSKDLAEAKVPGVVIAEWDMVMHTIVWVCPACPIL